MSISDDSKIGTPDPPQGGLPEKKTTHSTFRPTEQILKDFDEQVLQLRLTGQTEGKNLAKARCAWKVAMKLIIAADIDDRQLFRSPEIIFRKMAEERISLGYSKKILRVMNAWGQWQEPPLAVIPSPRGFFRERIRTAYGAKCAEKGSTKVSQPMTKELLEVARRKMRRSHYRWLYVAFYLGLRPKEADQLKDPSKVRIENIGGRETIFIYQSKLMQIEEDKRWKPIPVILAQQSVAVSYVKQGGLRRPSYGVLHKHLGRGVHLYAGRKGFSGMLVKQGVDLQAASIMLGHKSLETTVKHYSNTLEAQIERIRQLSGGKK